MAQTQANINNWPVRYPAVLTSDLQPPDYAQKDGWLKGNQGDEVMCVSRIKIVNGKQRVQVQYPRDEGGRPGRQGWVQEGNLEIGKPDGPIIGDPLRVLLGAPRYIAIDHHTIRSKTGAGLLFDTVLGLLTIWHANLRALPKVPQYLQGAWIHTPQARQDMARKFCEGVRAVNPRLLDLLNSGNFSLDDIASRAPIVYTGSPNGGKTGMYMNIAKDFREEPARQPELYMGKTMNSFGARYDQHLDKASAALPKGNHYRAAKKAKFYKMYVLCYLDEDDEDPERARSNVFEQINTDLFETSSPSVRNLQTVEDTLDDSERDQVTANGDKVTRAAKYALDKENALVFGDLAKKVFRTTGWPGGCRREPGTSTKSFGSSVGLNWTMPLTERLLCKTVWTMIEKPGKFAEYRRTNCNVELAEGLRRFFTKSYINLDGSTKLSNWYLPNGVGPPVGTKLHVVVEIRLDGQPHAIPHGLQATVGPMSDFDEANEVGMRIEWQNAAGQWMQEYVQMKQQYNRHNEAHPTGITAGYLRCTALRAFLKQEHRPVTAQFPFLTNYGIAKVKKISIDHLTQTITSQLLAATGKPRPANKPLRWQTDAQQSTIMRSLGVQHTPAPVGNLNQYPPVNQAFRKITGKAKVRCDWCHFGIKIAGRKKLECMQVWGKAVCGDCERMGRGCNYTHEDIMNQSQALQRASFTPGESKRGASVAESRIFVAY
ncbi:hypothetical protein CKM354_000635000 [Cercospora kikuchii]|uniref:Uncharacterized protein n=1 Tax=Cercospora kikuchii TaxID=84275 RepID=A0A9P3FI48_9PEZI|nr:uncharacterized protein CKM354_000635000 [Cercospora kikuchii]GIZ43110.1 hypothetical protein CKM354_000635000 [Cercospora kikuchii]